MPVTPMLPRNTEFPLLFREPRAFVVRYRWALLILWAGASADLWTTLVNIERFGPAIEAHIPQRILSEVLGIAVGVPLAKLIQIGFVIGLAAWWKPWCRSLFIICGVLYGAAAVSNHFLLL